VPPLGSRLRYWLCVRSLLSAHLFMYRGRFLASTHRGEYSLFVVATAPTLTGSDEWAMNLAACVTIFKDLLTKFQQLWP
jgi:hypothetical protein